MRKKWWQCNQCQAWTLQANPVQCIWCQNSEFTQAIRPDCDFDCWDESWDCGCDHHFHHSNCPATEIKDGELLHCMSDKSHNFSHSAWFHGEITHWRNEREGAYEGMAELMEMVRGTKEALTDLGVDV